MKVYIGPYSGGWWGPYQIAALLRFVGVSERRHQAIGKRLASTRLNDLCEWVESKRPGRRQSIRIDNYDVWSADHTLALVIAPTLRRLKEQNHGSPNVEDEDVPEYLRRTAAPPLDPEMDWGKTDDNWHLRWDWIMDEMIWAFEQIADGLDDEPSIKENRAAWDAYQARVDNGLRLFGRYYRGLWD